MNITHYSIAVQNRQTMQRKTSNKTFSTALDILEIFVIDSLSHNISDNHFLALHIDPTAYTTTLFFEGKDLHYLSSCLPNLKGQF